MILNRPDRSTIQHARSSHTLPTIDSPPPARIRRTCVVRPAGDLSTAILTVAILGALCLTHAGCKTTRGPTWGQRSAHAAGLQDAGHLDRAERAYRQLLEDVPAESRDARYIQSKLAEIAAERGRFDTALRRYRLAWEGHNDETAAAARFDAASLRARHLDQTQQAIDEWFAIITAYPGTATAERSAEHLSRHFARAGTPSIFADRADTLYPHIEQTLGADNLLFWVAKCFEHADRSGLSASQRRRKARSWYRRLLRDQPDSSMADDAHWELARHLDRAQRWRAALRHYRKLAGMYRPSWLVGSYSSPYASRARYRLGEIHLLFTDDYPAATRHFQQYLSDFPTLRYADDSAWHLAHLARLRGDSDAYTQRLERFVDEYDHSRYVDRANKLLNALRSTHPHARRD